MTRHPLLLALPLLSACAAPAALSGQGSGAPSAAAATAPPASSAAPTAAAPLAAAAGSQAPGSAVLPLAAASSTSPAVVPPAPAPAAAAATPAGIPCTASDRVLWAGVVSLPPRDGGNTAHVELRHAPERPYLVDVALHVPVATSKDGPQLYGLGVPNYVPAAAPKAKRGTPPPEPVPALGYGVWRDPASKAPRWLFSVERRDTSQPYAVGVVVSEPAFTGKCE